MARYTLTAPAQRDMIEIFARSEELHGEAARVRYERLLTTALRDIASEPMRPGSRELPEEFGPGRRVYHLG